MLIPIVQFNPWDKNYALNPNNLKINRGDFIIASIDHGTEAGKIIDFEEISETQLKELNINRVIDRQATSDDLEIIKSFQAEKEATLDFCKKLIKKHGLEMKLVDAYFSFDNQRLTFAFIADGRVDFRELVKELGRHFQKLIRLHQIGVRDEAKLAGNIGCCGLIQCCRGHLKKLGNVVSEYAEDQQVVHRGSERLSGVCGRLKCCLAYEEDLYKELAQKLPPIGTQLKTKYGKGEVIGWHTLKGVVEVRIEPERGSEKPIIAEIPINELNH